MEFILPGDNQVDGEQLLDELAEAGVTFSVDVENVFFFRSPNTVVVPDHLIPNRETGDIIKAVIAAHVPQPRVQRATTEEKVNALWRYIVDQLDLDESGVAALQERL